MKQKTLILILFVYLSTIFSLSANNEQTQNNNDSLLFELIKCKQDTNKVFLLLKIAKIYKEQGNSKDLEFAKQALSLSKEIAYKKGVAYSNYFFSRVFLNYDTDMSQEFIIKTLALAKASIKPRYIFL